MEIRSKHVGAVAGLLFGFLVIRYGFVVAVFVLALAAAGWFVGRVLDGEADLPVHIPRRERDEVE